MNVFDRLPRQASAKHCGYGPNGRNLCYCGCKREVSPPRQNWFSAECVTNWHLRNDPGVQRNHVERRDKEVCAGCGFDCRALDQRLHALRKATLRKSYRDTITAVTRVLKTLPDGWGRVIKVDQWGVQWRHLWEMDHIVPVVEGGGGCDPSNLRTLCIPCHKIETRKLAGRRSRAARIAASHPVLL